jgi:hypothetical protein
MEGVIYVMSNNCFMIKDHYKIGFTTDIEQRKKAYTTAFPVACNWEYISETVNNIRTRERLIFQRLKEYRFNDSREYFICPIDTIKEVIEDVLKMELKEMNIELNIKDWTTEMVLFLKKVIKKTDKKKYNKVLIEDLYRNFLIWCISRSVKKKCSMDDFYIYLEDKGYKIKYTSIHPEEYLEKVEYKV